LRAIPTTRPLVPEVPLAASRRRSPQASIGGDGGLPLDNFRVGRMPATEEVAHSRPSRTIAADGRLSPSPDSCRVPRMLLTAEPGHERPSIQSDRSAFIHQPFRGDGYM